MNPEATTKMRALLLILGLVGGGYLLLAITNRPVNVPPASAPAPTVAHGVTPPMSSAAPTPTRPDFWARFAIRQPYAVDARDAHFFERPFSLNLTDGEKPEPGWTFVGTSLYIENLSDSWQQLDISANMEKNQPSWIDSENFSHEWGFRRR
jgi:hypothetical protein